VTFGKPYMPDFQRLQRRFNLLFSLMRGGEIQTGKTAIRDISALDVTLHRCHLAGGDRENENAALCMWVLVRYKGEQ
jgi:hypothetical protein